MGHAEVADGCMPSQERHFEFAPLCPSLSIVLPSPLRSDSPNNSPPVFASSLAGAGLLGATAPGRTVSVSAREDVVISNKFAAVAGEDSGVLLSQGKGVCMCMCMCMCVCVCVCESKSSNRNSSIGARLFSHFPLR